MYDYVNCFIALCILHCVVPRICTQNIPALVPQAVSSLSGSSAACAVGTCGFESGTAVLHENDIEHYANGALLELSMQPERVNPYRAQALWNRNPSSVRTPRPTTPPNSPMLATPDGPTREQIIERVSILKKRNLQACLLQALHEQGQVTSDVAEIDAIGDNILPSMRLGMIPRTSVAPSKGIIQDRINANKERNEHARLLGNKNPDSLSASQMQQLQKV